jgi:hypothetical protein
MTDRTRTITWDDPAPGTAQGLAMAGIDYVQAIVKGALPAPPIAATMQFELVEAEFGRGKGYTSVEIKVSYLKAVRATSGLLTATGTVVKSGSRVGFTEAVVTDASGAVVATASSTLLVFDL